MLFNRFQLIKSFMLAGSLLCSAFTLPTACQNEIPHQAYFSDETLEDLNLSVEDRYLIGKISLDIMKRYSPSAYIYVFLGRSPTPFHAFFTAIKPHLKHLTFTSIPYSSVQSTESKIELEGLSDPVFQDNRDLFQKMISHFDLYLQKLILAETSKSQPRRILVIDYTQTGHSLGEAKRQIDFYLHYQAGTDPKKAAFKSIKTEYLALADRDKLVGLKNRIDTHKKAYKTKLKGKVSVDRVGVDGLLFPTVIDIDERVKILRQSLNTNWHWQGSIIDLNSYLSDPNAVDSKLLQQLQRQEFDAFSLYGGWYLGFDQLDKEPRIYKQFYELVDILRPNCR